MYVVTCTTTTTTTTTSGGGGGVTHPVIRLLVGVSHGYDYFSKNRFSLLFIRGVSCDIICAAMLYKWNTSILV